MKHLHLTLLASLAIIVGACSSNTLAPDSARQLARNTTEARPAPSSRETVLLVSLDDGTVIMQTIVSSADVCFKQNSDMATTCLTRGAPIYNPGTNTIIGFEMIEGHINLQASSD